MSDKTEIQLAEDLAMENYEDLFGDFFSKADDELPPPPPSGGFMRICPRVTYSVKDNNKLVRMGCADDAADQSANFVVAPAFRKKTFLFAPITHAFGHESWNDGKKVVDTPGSLDNCEYCLINADSKNEMDRCENHSKLVFFVIDTKDTKDTKKWEIQGLYHIDQSSKTTFEEPYNFFFDEMRHLYQQRQVPFSRIYRMTTISREKNGGIAWNIPRIVREADDVQGGSFPRDAHGKRREYASMETPDHLLKEMAKLLAKDSPIHFAVSLFQLSGKEAFEKMQEKLSGRKPVLPSGGDKKAVTAGKTAKPEVVDDGDGADAFLGVD